MSNKRPPQNAALAALRNQPQSGKKLEAQQNSLVSNPQLHLASGVSGVQQLQQSQEQQQQVPCFDALYPHRHFFTESGIGSRDGRPVVPIPSSKTEPQFRRVGDTAKVLVQFQTSWKTGYPDDAKRGTALDGAIIPNSRFPGELSAFGQPIRKPKIKLAVSHAESRLLNRNRRRQREGDGKDSGGGNPNKKKIGGAATAGGDGKGGGKDGEGGAAEGKQDGKENGDGLEDDEDDDDNEDDDDDDYSDDDGNNDDDDDDYGGNGDDGELAF